MTLEERLTEDMVGRRLSDFQPVIAVTAAPRSDLLEQHILVMLVDMPPKQSPPVPETDPHLRNRFRLNRETARKLRDDLNRALEAPQAGVLDTRKRG